MTRGLYMAPGRSHRNHFATRILLLTRGILGWMAIPFYIDNLMIHA